LQVVEILLLRFLNLSNEILKIFWNFETVHFATNWLHSVPAKRDKHLNKCSPSFFIILHLPGRMHFILIRIFRCTTAAGCTDDKQIGLGFSIKLAFLSRRIYSTI